MGLKRGAIVIPMLLALATTGVLAAAQSAQKKPDGFDRYLVALVTPRVAPGAYRLRLNFSEPGTGRTLRTETDVEIGGS